MARLLSPHKTYPLVNISLDEKETEILDLLSGFSQKLAQDTGKQCSPRISGGWVRDKLLGRPSHDIDVAVDQILGEEFATKLAESVPKTKLHKIAKNPDKLKHLETVTTTILGYPIDIVSLRCEHYADELRVPDKVTFGTPEEDALRRDATLNALFYNVNERKVEDPTKRGIEDLKAGILRTPLDPLQTFLDDPLRILRLFRFLAQFGFAVDPKAVEAVALHDAVKDALLRKVSRERVGTEMGKLLGLAYPLAGLNLLWKTGLFEVLFLVANDPKVISFASNSFGDRFGESLSRIASLIDEIPSTEHDSVQNELTHILDPESSSKDLRLCFYLCFMLQDLQSKSEAMAIGKKKVARIEYVLREAFHFGKATVDLVTKVLVHDEQNLATYLREDVFSKPSVLSLVIRNYAGNEYWRLSLTYNYCKACLEEDTKKMERLSEVYLYIIHNKLDTIYLKKPSIDGKELCRILDKKPGKWMKEALDEMVFWEIDGGDPHEYVEKLKN